MRWCAPRALTALLFVTSLVLAPVVASAQDEAGISGIVTDSQGLALPGVTVVAESPQLIEQSRTVFADGSGQYRFVALPPGTYSVSFQLQGFSTLIRDGVVLEGAFVAAVDAELAVGQVAESVTVTGAAPLVDVVSTREQLVLTEDQVNVLPGANNLITSMQYVPGVTGNFLAVEGLWGMRGPSVHGSEGPDSQSHIDGVETGTQMGGRSESVGGVGLVTDEAQISEVVYDTSSMSAEYGQSGIRTNMIPKTGSNVWTGDVFVSGTTDRYASSNISPALAEQGFKFAPQAWNYRLNPSIGGPIMENKVWFFGSMVHSESKTFRTDINFDPNHPTTPEGLGDDLRAFGLGKSGVQNGRVTVQLGAANKVTTSFTNQQNNFGRVVGTGFGRVASEALFDGTSDPNYLSTTRWTSMISSRLLLETTVAYQRLDLKFKQMEGHGPGSMAFTDSVSGLASGNSILQGYQSEDHRRTVNVALSYVTGSHNLKAGMQYNNNLQYFKWKNNGDIFQGMTAGGWPYGILVMTNGDAEDQRNQNCDCGFYVQDAITLDRLTINGGLRFDYFNNSLTGGLSPAGNFSPEINAPPINDLPNWKDWNGRFGFAYDLSGDGRTALKFSTGRYVANEALGITSQFSPFGFKIDYRPWSDLNYDGTALNADGTPQYNEIGASYNPKFGQPTTANRLDPDTPRKSNMEYSGGIEHQLGNSWSISAKYHRRDYSNFRWDDNTALSTANWQAVTFTSPSDSRLSNSGDTLTVYDLVDGYTVTTGDILTRHAPDDRRTWNGFEVIADGRLWRDGFSQISWTAGETNNDFCTGGRLENPNSLRFCKNSTGIRHSFKFSGGIPLPYDTMFSGLFQVFAGNVILGNYQVDATDTGRALNLAGLQDPGINIALIEPGTSYEPARGDLNLRFSKVVTTGNVRTRIYMDASNLFNNLQVTARNRFFGGGTTGQNDEFFRPINITAGRTLSWGFQTSF